MTATLFILLPPLHRVLSLSLHRIKCPPSHVFTVVEFRKAGQCSLQCRIQCFCLSDLRLPPYAFYMEDTIITVRNSLNAADKSIPKNAVLLLSHKSPTAPILRKTLQESMGTVHFDSSSMSQNEPSLLTHFSIGILMFNNVSSQLFTYLINYRNIRRQPFHRIERFF